jgi:hypothetical protein
MPNYCGIKPILVGGWGDRACEWHDEAYEPGSPAQDVSTRTDVDKRFLVQLKAKANGNPFQLAQAYLFYGIVRSFGWIWWEGKP